MVSYSALVNVYAKAGLADRAVHLVDHRMPSTKGVEPDQVTHVSVLDALCNAGEFQRAVERFQRVRDPCLPMANTAMRAYHELGRHSDLRELWERLPKMGLEPTHVTVAVFARSLAAQGKVDEVNTFFEEKSSFRRDKK